MIKLRLVGRGPMHRLLVDPIFTQELMEGLRIHFGNDDWEPDAQTQAWCWMYALESRTGVEIDLNALLTEDSFTGELVRVSLELEANAADGAVFVEEALAPLMMNARLRKLIGTKIEERSVIWLQQARELAASLLTEEAETLPAAKQDSGEGEA